MNIKGTKNKILIEGNLIIDHVEDAKKELLKKLENITPGKPVVLDLSRVEEIDSSGLQLLVAFFKSLQNKGINFNVTSINKDMLEVLNISGLAKYFRLEK